MNKTMVPFLCIIVGSLITVFAAFYDYKEKLEDKQKQLDAEIKRNSEYQTLLHRSESIINSQRSVIENSKTIIDLQSELAKKNEAINKLQKDTYEIITGGESVPSLSISVSSGTIDVQLYNKDKFAIRNVEGSISRNVRDANSTITGLPRRITDGPSITIKNISLNDVLPNTQKSIYHDFYDKTFINLTYTYQIKWLTGHYSGRFTVRDKGNKQFEIVNNNIFSYLAHTTLDDKILINGAKPQILPLLRIHN